MSRARATLSFALLGLCVCCESGPPPVGTGAQPDGEFTIVDAGARAGADQYRVTINEPLDLSRALTVRYELSGLPTVELVGYLDLPHPLPLSSSPDPAAHPWVATTLELRLEDASGVVLFRERAPLSAWTWSGSVGGPSSALYTQATIFTPLPDETYVLVAEVVPAEVKGADVGAPMGALALRGGGWKVEGREMPISSILFGR